MYILDISRVGKLGPSKCAKAHLKVVGRSSKCAFAYLTARQPNQAMGEVIFEATCDKDACLAPGSGDLRLSTRRTLCMAATASATATPKAPQGKQISVDSPCPSCPYVSTNSPAPTGPARSVFDDPSPAQAPNLYWASIFAPIDRSNISPSSPSSSLEGEEEKSGSSSTPAGELLQFSKLTMRNALDAIETASMAVALAPGAREKLNFALLCQRTAVLFVEEVMGGIDAVVAAGRGGGG